MSIRFACPSCGASGSVDATLAGKRVRCKQCRYHFNIPGPGGPEADVYALDEPAAGSAGFAATSPAPSSTFVPRRGDEPTSVAAPRKGKRSASGSSTITIRRQRSDFAWRAWPIRGLMVVVLVSAMIALFAPRGTLLVGCLLLFVGSAMVLVGYAAGAYGAFHEDFLYGILYLLVPLYAAYYLVTRWDDLWPWFACATAGVALVALGTEMLSWSGVGS